MKHLTDTRNSILENAEAQFAEKGYESSSIRDIADRADINPAVIYYHFRSKEELYRTIFTLRLGQLSEALQEIDVKTSWNSFAKLNSYITAYVKKIRDNFYFYRLLNAEIFSFRDGFFKVNILENVASNITLFRRVLREGIDRKEFRAIDIDLFLMSLFHLLHQVIGRSPLTSEILELEEFPEEELVERISGFLFYLLYPKTEVLAMPSEN